MAFVALACVLGCSDPTAPSSGQVQVRLTDAPIDLSNVTAVNVTIDSIELFPVDAPEDGTEMERPGVVAGEGLTLNLLDFQNGESIVVATIDSAPAEFAKIRLQIASAELVRPDPDDAALSIVEPIFVPSGKVDVLVPFTLAGGDTAEITLDFDAALSVHVNETPGQHHYILRPVIVPISIH